MASRPRHTIAIALTLTLTAWIWGLAGLLYVLRWNSVTRPAPPAKEAFVYGELRVGIDPGNPPFAVATADDLYGLDVDLANALGERLNIPVRFVLLGYDGLYDALRVDSVDVLISALLVDPTRRNEVRYTLPYFNAGLMLVSAAGSPYANMRAMPGHALSYEFGSQAEVEARLWLRRVLPFETRPYELTTYALDAVSLGESDAALADAVSARLYLREHSDWTAQTNIVRDAWYAIATRVDRGKTWESVNLALQSLIDDATVDALIAKWL